MARAASPGLTRASHVWSVLAAVVCLLPLLLQLPAHVSAGIGFVAVVIGGSSWTYRPPGWARLLLSLSLLGIVLSTFGFSLGRDTGCALLAAMLALKPVELPTLRDARSLLGFALFAPFATFLLDQGALSLLLGLAGALLVLAAMTRLAEQDVGDVAEISGTNSAADAGTGLSTRQRLSMVLRLVAIGLPLALAAFWLFPRIASPLWGVPELSQARPGLSDEMSPGQWLDLMGDDTPALRVQFFGTTPPPEQMYWRGPVLSDFDGRTWSGSLWLRAQPAASVAHAQASWDYEVEIEPTDRPQLLALDLLRDAPTGSRLTHEHSLLAERPLRSVSRWRLRSSPSVRFEPDLPPTLRQLMLHLPEGYNPRSLALARGWRADIGDDARIVEHALQWIRGEFGYTLSTPLPGRHAADEFLFDWKKGFCEHYSSAFAILMRAAGIPARVVTGYVGGYRNTFGDYWVVRRMDAHAWNEVWLAGRGWVRVDPTAAVAPERVYDTIEDRLGGGAGNRALSPMFDASDWLRRGWNDLVLGFDATRQQAILRPLGLSGTGARGLAGLFALMAVLTLGWMLWLSARGEREHDAVLRAWHRLQARYARHGLGREAHEPVPDWVRRISARCGDDPDLQALSQRFVKWRYARGQGDVDRQQTLVRDLRRHRPNLRTPRPA